MRRAILLSLGILILFSFSQNSNGQQFNKKIIGYYTSWSIYARNYHVPDIPADKINYINYAFANIDNSTGTIKLGDYYADVDKWYPGDSWEPGALRGCFHQLQILKANNPHLKTLISIGGWTWSTYFSNIALTQESREIFASSCVEFIQQYEFDGVDLDWEYPVSGGLGSNIYRPEDKENFTLLLAELRSQLDQAGDYLLTIAAPSSPFIQENIEIDQIHQYLDWINIMTYDLHGPWCGAPDPVTNFNTPLYMVADDPTPEPYHSTFNLSAAVEAYLNQGVPSGKVHASLAFYGRGFGGVPNVNNGLFASYTGPANAGTWEDGVFDYWDLAQNYIDMSGYVSYWNEEAKVPWLYNPNTQNMISYDNPQSMEIKVNYIKSVNLGGVMFWEFSGDKYGTLLNAVYEEVNNTTQYTQQISLPQGFSFVSSRIIPENPDMLIVLNDILNDNLGFVRNSQGQMLQNIGGNWVNNIGNWISTEGYLFKMNSDDVLIIDGEAVNPQTPINLNTGYQFISYLPNETLDALDAFASILNNDLDFIRNSDGGVLRKIGPNWVNGIGNTIPGEGYLIKMFAEYILTYPDSLAFTCGEPFTDLRDGQTYNTVQIGEQCWMAENLNLGTMINGMEEMTDNGEFEKYCYEDDNDNCNEYGGLYTWNEIMQYETDSAIQGICPQDWHIPTDYELKILEGNTDSQYSAGDPIWDDTGYRGFDAARNLKSLTTWSKNPGINIFGFTSLAGGYRQSNGNFGNMGNYTLFWSSTNHNEFRAWMRRMIFYANNISRNYYNKNYGFSLRCLHNNYLSDREKNRIYNLTESKIENFEPTHFVFNGGNPADPVYTIYVSGLEIGDEVAVFDNGKIVGANVINSENVLENAVPVFSTLNNEKGYETANIISLRVFDSEAKKEIPISFEMKNSYGDAFTERYFPAEDGEYSILKIIKNNSDLNDVSNNINIYPNPANDIINISSNEVINKIEIINLSGQILINSVENSRNVRLNMETFSSGVYLIKIYTSDNIKTKIFTIN
ncbi:MAG: T9SS type A sorting domain-containing protein [Bacteroidales bacterium]|nr:T9SS type A sorting domain-containing protein [Bacteroidales bacterium]